MKEKVLIITYYWPPSGGSGVQRWAYFSKYLKKLDFEPIVLTVDENKASYPYLDYSLEKEVKDITVFKTDSFEPLQIYSKIASGDRKKAIPYGDVPTKNQSFFKKMAAFIRGNFILPDARKYWRKHALPKAKELIEKEDIKLVITTGPPHSTHLIGLALKKKMDIKWIADFRDPWTEIFYNKDLYKTTLAKRIDARLEAKVLGNADQLTAVSPYSKELIDKKISTSSKSHCFYNGFDHEIFDRIEKIDHTADLTFAYVGYIGKHHQHEIITKGMQALIKAQPDKKIKLHLAGNIDKTILATWNSIAGLDVNHEGIVSHQRAVSIICNATIVLVNIPNSTYAMGNIPGKLLECLASENPLILIAENKSDAAKLIAEFDNTTTVSRENQGDFLSFCKDVIHQKVTKDDKRSEIMRFSRKAIVVEINALLRKMLN